MAKPPFEKILSLIDRKNLFLKAAKDNAEIIVKDRNQVISSFIAGAVRPDGHVVGRWSAEGIAKEKHSVMAFFYSGKDRYFLHTNIQPLGKYWKLHITNQFYKLNRRNQYRVSVPTDLDFKFHVQSVRGIDVSRDLQILDYSSSGARIVYGSESQIGVGTPLKGFLHLEDKVIPIDAQIIHSPKRDIYGIRFVNLTPTQQNRLKMISIEAQQMINFGYIRKKS